MKKQKKSMDVFNLSFLDVISCGFGAIILLLVISKASEPLVLKTTGMNLESKVQRLNHELDEVRTMSRAINLNLVTVKNSLSKEKETLARLLSKKSSLLAQLRAAKTDMDAQNRIEQQLEKATQKLTEEMKRLRTIKTRPVRENIIGGVPVDSEYIIFVIDTSGSMYRYAWHLVQRKIKEILAIYPHVKGIQVINDMGNYMFSQYAGQWIPDTPARRRVILRRLANWTPFSNSSPVEGIEGAIASFWNPGKRISIYYFGDDFSHGSIQDVLNKVNRLNRPLTGGKRMVRIHAVGFPTLILHGGNWNNVVRFAALMRKLAEDNNGSFVGLNGQ